jgi:hypothetical protein
MSLAIKFSELWTCSAADTEQKLPLSALPEDGAGHIHGRLEILVAGKALPHLGYRGPTDVCFGEWLQVLRDTVAALRSSSKAEYTYDEGEQGQPAFQWVRNDDTLLLSIVDSVLSDGTADPAWQDIACSFEGFTQEVAKFEASFRAALLSDAPVGGPAWFKKNLRPAA